MALTTVQNMIIGMIVFVVVLTGGVAYLGTFYHYDSTIDTINGISNFNSTLNKAATVTADVNAIQTNIVSTNATGLAQAVNYFNIVFNGAFNGLKTMFDTTSMITSLPHDIGVAIGMSDTTVTVMLGLLVLIVIVIVGFAIWASVMRVNV